MLFIKEAEVKNSAEWINRFNILYAAKKAAGIPVFAVTAASVKEIQTLLKFDIPVFTCDGTAIKTAARVNPTLFLMKGPVIQNKWAGADFEKALK